MPREKSREYQSGYGQALADVLQSIAEIEATTLGSELPEDLAVWANDPEAAVARGKDIRLGLQWMRAAVRGLARRKVGR